MELGPGITGEEMEDSPSGGEWLLFKQFYLRDQSKLEKRLSGIERKANAVPWVLLVSLVNIIVTYLVG